MRTGCLSYKLVAMDKMGDQFIMSISPAGLLSQEYQERINEEAGVHREMWVKPIISSALRDSESL